MPNNKSILVVGELDFLEKISLSDSFEITIAANFEEATEQLEKHTFGHVITDAVLPEEKSGLDLLKQMKLGGNCIPTSVCHSDSVCPTPKKNWSIERSLEVHFKFASFHKGTITTCLNAMLMELQQCA
jgi:DNA-binding NtrC family response regulator